MQDIHGCDKHTVFRIVHRITDALFECRDEIIRWPDDTRKLEQDFRSVAGKKACLGRVGSGPISPCKLTCFFSGFPHVCGVIDGCHVSFEPPRRDEAAYVNRHQTHSINGLFLSGPNYKYFYVSASAPGRFHDTRVSFFH